MGEVIKRGNLLSSIIRRNVVAGKAGEAIFVSPPSPSGGGSIRKINNLGAIAKQPGESGIISIIFNASKKFSGFIGGLISSLSISFSAIFGWIIGKIEQLKAFDWNTTDKQIEQSIKENNVNIARIWGGFAGETAGWLMGIGFGAAASYLVPVIGGSQLAKLIVARVSDEAGKETVDNFFQAINLSIENFAQSGLLLSYRGIRGMIKRADPSFLESLFGKDGAKWIREKWGNEGEPEISFNTKMDEKIDSISNIFLKAFVDEFLEESWETFIEAGFVITAEIDAQYAAVRAAETTISGPDRGIIVYPNKLAKKEKYVLPPLPQKQAIEQATSLVTTARQFKGRELGIVVAQKIEGAISAFPYLQGLKVEMCAIKEPPWIKEDGTLGERHEISIPNLKKTVKWIDVKRVFTGWMYGPHKCTIFLTNRRQIVFSFLNETEATVLAKNLADLTDAEVRTVRFSKSVEEEHLLRVKPYPIFPKKGTILLRDALIKPDGSFDINATTTKTDFFSFLLWTDNKPEGIKDPLWTNRD